MGPSDRRRGWTPDQGDKRHHAPVCHLNGLHLLQHTPVCPLGRQPGGRVQQSRNQSDGPVKDTCGEYLWSSKKAQEGSALPHQQDGFLSVYVYIICMWARPTKVVSFLMRHKWGGGADITIAVWLGNENTVGKTRLKRQGQSQWISLILCKHYGGCESKTLSPV